MALRFLLNRGAARCAGLLVGIAPLSAGPGAAQAVCDDPDVTVMATAPSLEGYEILFSQNSVSFYTRLPARDSAGPATVLIRNGNRYPVEVSYGVELQLQGEAGARTLSLGRHCVRIGPQGYASSIESAPPRTIAVRVRNLTISNLANAPTQIPAPATGSAADPRTTSPGEPPVGAAPGAVGPADSAAAAAPLLEALPDTLAPPSVQAPIEVSQEETEASPPVGPGRAVVNVVTRVFYLAAVVVLTLAGLALLPPVLATLYLLLFSLVVLVGRLFRSRGDDSHPPGAADRPDGS